MEHSRLKSYSDGNLFSPRTPLRVVPRYSFDVNRRTAKPEDFKSYVDLRSSSESLSLHFGERELLKNELQILAKDVTLLILKDNTEETIRNKYKEWMYIFERYQILYNQLDVTQCDAAVLVEFRNECLRFRKYVEEWFQLQRGENTIDSKDSVSNSGSKKSSRSQSQYTNISSLRVRQEQERAELIEKQKSLQRKQQLEKEKLEMKLKEERLELETKMAIAEAKAKVIDKEFSDKSSHRSANYKAESPEPSRAIPLSVPAVSNDYSENPANFNRDLILSLKRPQITVNKFGGEATEFTKFMRQFNCSVLIYCDTWEDKINSLDFYTYGEANKIVAGLSYLDAERAFKLAVQELTERYGDPEVIATAYIEKALKWQQIKSDSPKTLDSFGIFLTECLYAVRNIDAVQILNYSENIKVIASKLPFGLHDKWRNVVRNTQKFPGRRVSFEQLVEFVREEAKKSNDPIFGREAMNAATKTTQQTVSPGKYQNNRPQSQIKTVKSKNFTTSIEPCCQLCSGKHVLSDCEKLSKLPRNEILELISKDKLCFGCLKPGHQRFKCWNKLTCKKCNRKHPTVLHSDQQQNTDEKNNLESLDPVKALVSTEAGATNTMRCTMPVVPVKVVNGCKIVDSYAFTDVGSSVCFVTNSLKDKLGLHGKNTQMTLQTMNGSKNMPTTIVNGIQVFSYDMTDSIVIPMCYTVEQTPVTNDDIPRRTDISQYAHLSDIFIPELECEIGLIIGNNISEAYCPKEYRIGPRGSPHASKTAIGWILWNVMREEKELLHCASSRILANRINMCSEFEKLKDLDRLVRNVMNFDFPERNIDDKKEKSALDDKFLQKVNDSVALIEDNHYQINLPFKDSDVVLPKNYRMALDRLESLKRKLSRNSDFAKDYVKFMNTLFENSYAEEVTSENINFDSDKLWYIPHHGVYHKQKGKLRVVFDCSAKFRGVSLNDTLLSGPDLSNNLLGVLLRFRLGKIAVMADIEGMFHQVKVPPQERCSLRFLWWPGGDITLQPKHYQMTAHLFGAVSSPSCANFALKMIASDNAYQYDENTINSVLNDFYVDDLLKSMDCNMLEASNLVKKITDLCKLGGFRLHKWISNNDIVLNSIPATECANVQQCSLFEDDPVVERALGLLWDVNSDSLTFQINLSNKPCTRRGILSIVSAVYDPLGLVAPALLPAKMLLQELCQSGYGWDDRLNERFSSVWSNWLLELPLLQTLEIPRCVKPTSFGDINSIQLHHFSDASEVGYGVASYLRLIDNTGVICCSLILGKSRVAPLKKITIPRMELTAATVATRINKKLMDELKCPIDQTYFWTDSTTVLRYISNYAARFKTFVANRASVIREATSVEQWKYISTKDNPADISSRGIPVKSLMKDNKWFQGPSFLSQDESCWPNGKIPKDMVYSTDSIADDPETKRLVNVLLPNTEKEHPLDRLITYYSSWTRLIRAVAIWKKFISKLSLKSKSNNEKSLSHFQLTCHDIDEAKLMIVRYEQSRYLSELVKVCSEETQVNNLKLLRSHKVSKLDPYMVNGVLRVGGRLERAIGDTDFKHPIILAKESIVSTLIVREAHRIVGHLGKNSTLAEIRKTFWIIGGSTLIKSILSVCVACRKYSANKLQQKMADLPTERLISGEPPFNRTGIDYFGPFEIKRARSIVKRYGVIFTCMNSRAVHLEISTSLDTDSCINAIRRFIARRGTPKFIRSDNGTNLVGANRELKQCIDNWNTDKLTKEFIQKGIDWQFNPPSASHFGGVWERLIRIVRKVLCSLQKDQLNRLDDESLQTLMCEVEQILNNRPITKVADTPDDLEALTPSHLLNSGYQNSYYAPTITQEADGYLKRRWRQVQYLTNIFWKRWTHEYLPCLQERQKWLFPKRNISVNDIVLVIDSNIRNSWALARVIKVISDKNGLSRIVTVKTKAGILQRPITKLSLILECDE